MAIEQDEGTGDKKPKETEAQKENIGLIHTRKKGAQTLGLGRA